MGDVPSSLVVVIPARNEERRLNGCLLALRAAIQHFRLLHVAVPVRVVLVLDRCTTAPRRWPPRGRPWKWRSPRMVGWALPERPEYDTP
jgi:hypothetical protein